MVGIAQSVRASGCGSEGRRFDSGYLPHFVNLLIYASIAQLDRATPF